MGIQGETRVRSDLLSDPEARSLSVCDFRPWLSFRCRSLRRDVMQLVEHFCSW